jgi:hypothetical protein
LKAVVSNKKAKAQNARKPKKGMAIPNQFQSLHKGVGLLKLILKVLLKI